MPGADHPVKIRWQDVAFSVAYWLFMLAILAWWGQGMADARNWRESYNPEDVPDPVAFDTYAASPAVSD